MSLNISQICERESHSSDITSCDFSKTGILATSSSDQTIKLWSIKNKELVEIATLKGHKYAVNFCRFSPQGTLLASASTDSTTIIWDVKSCDNLCSFIQPSGFAVRVCQFCPNSAFLATAGDDDLICIWNIGDKELVRTIRDHEATIFSLAFSPDGNLLLTSDAMGRCKVWATQPGHKLLLSSVEEAHDLGVTSVSFSPQWTVTVLDTWYSVVTCGSDGFVCLWDVRTGADNTLTCRGRVYAHDGSAMCVDYSPDGKFIASSGGDKVVKIWAVGDLTCMAVLEGHFRYVTACAFSKDGVLLATGSNDRHLKVWVLGKNEESSNSEEDAISSRSENYFQLKLLNNGVRNKVIQTLTAHSSDVNTCDFHGNVLATGSADTTVRVWEENQTTGQFEENSVSPLRGHTYSVYCVKFSQNGNLVSAALDGGLILWDVGNGKQLKSFFHPEHIGFRVVRVSPDGRFVIAGGDDNCCHVWNLDSNVVQVLTGHENTLLAMDVSKTGELVATGCSGGTLRIWAMESFQSVITIDDVHDLGITSCVFKPTENDHETTIVTAGNDADIKVWDFDQKNMNMNLKIVLKGHSAPVMSIAFSTAGNFLASTSGDKTARIWETESYRCAATLGPHARYVTSGVFSQNLNIFAASFDRFVGLWKLHLDEATEFDNIPASEWSQKQVRSWLGKLGFCRYAEQFSLIEGKKLVDLTSRDITDLGVSDSDSEEILQSIQWVRFGSRCTGGAGFVDDVPNEYLCPITYDLMANPVKCSDGFIYEESAIKEWLLTRKNTSPMTNLEMADVELVPCPDLRTKIEQFKKSS